ncbi:MAG: hypothetical protein J6P42_06355 [Oscillospiraceae bacterium]|nr:hypothetical protein [Oscillospiraceae bacterium]
MRKPYWTRRTHLFRADEYICSACGRVSAKPWKTCPECGSIMKKVKAEASWVDEMEAASAIVDDDW